MRIEFNSAEPCWERLLNVRVNLELNYYDIMPTEDVMILRVNDDGDVVVCVTDDNGTPIENATWTVPADTIIAITVR